LCLEANLRLYNLKRLNPTASFLCVDAKQAHTSHYQNITKNAFSLLTTKGGGCDIIQIVHIYDMLAKQNRQLEHSERMMPLKTENLY